MSKILSFDITLKEIPVTMGDKEYVLREATGAAACKYRNAMLGHAVLGESGKPISLKGMADIEPLLVSLCIFQKITKEDETVVEKSLSVKEVLVWPSSVITSLFKEAKDISNLDEDDDTEESLAEEQKDLDKRKEALNKETAKNVSSNTTAGSD